MHQANTISVWVDMHRLKHNAFTGMYHFSVHLAKALVAAQSKEIALSFYTPPSHVAFAGNGVQYPIHKGWHKWYLPHQQYNVWHVTTQLGRYFPHSKRTKVVLTIHDLNFLLESPNDVARNRKLLKGIQQKIDKSDCVVAISAFAMAQIQTHLSLTGKSTAVIYNGCNRYDKPVTPPGHLPQGKFLFSISSIEPRKYFHTLMPLLQHSEYYLLIAGNTTHAYTQVVLQAAQAAGVANRLILLGCISENDKYWYLQHCDAFVFPSQAEGFGLPVIEAMQYGKPCFLSTATCLPEVGGAAAYYFDSFEPDAMLQVFNAGMRDYTMNNRASSIQQHAAKYSWDIAAQQYIALYKQLAHA
ncbi:MAG TPA: glycosyltransferase family 1 protein [Chitinophagaceae bacterium]|nr:glycosyltransferase family 1 protein [Chitinophagaceae bacterium]HAN38195.1 glycosyltransferase family 1 protein [Chitinophagaceae bacterium]